MARFVIKNAKLSAAGITKLNRLADLAARGVSAMMEDFSDEIRERVAIFVFSEEEERFYLSIPGNDYNLYKREGGFLYLREAIMTEETVVKEANEIISAEFGRANEMNPKIGFGWYHSYGPNKEFRTTNDAEAGEAWSNLLQLWELGGSPFTITARDGGSMTIAKYGKDKVVVDSVIKTIPSVQPFTMYQATGYYMQPVLRRKVLEKLKEVISWL